MGLNSINGIKAIAMLMILAGHALSFIYGSPSYNEAFVAEVRTAWFVNMQVTFFLPLTLMQILQSLRHYYRLLYSFNCQIYRNL